MNSLFFLNTFEFLYNFLNTVFKIKIEALTVKLLVQSPTNYLTVIWNLVTKIFEIRYVSSIFENSDFSLLN